MSELKYTAYESNIPSKYDIFLVSMNLFTNRDFFEKYKIAEMKIKGNRIDKTINNFRDLSSAYGLNLFGEHLMVSNKLIEYYKENNLNDLDLNIVIKSHERGSVLKAKIKPGLGVAADPDRHDEFTIKKVSCSVEPLGIEPPS